jgi:hypothetical protein
MNIAQLSEQLKDVPQAKLVDYAKNPNSVVPQFLALAEIQRRQTLQRAMPGQPPQSTVAEDVMAQANPQPMQAPAGVAGLPTRGMYTAPESLAGGGIIAFADGGDTEDEYEEYMEKVRRSRLHGMAEKLSELGAFVKNPLAKLEGKQAPAQRMAVAETASDITPTKKGSHKYEDLVIAEAQRQGVDPNLARHVLYKETGNISNPESVRSKAGAIGVMQLMPKTAKMLGVDPTNPEENIRGGITYLKQMSDRYNDPVLAAAAYNAGPGRLDKALKGQGIQALPRETRMYIAGLAEGGEVKRYQVGGELEGFNPPDYAMDELRRQEALRKIREREEAEKQEFLKEAAPQLVKKEKPQVKKETTAPVPNIPAEVTPAFDRAPVPMTSPTREELGAPAEGAPKKSSYFDEIMKNINEQAEQAKKDKDMNKYLALMQAGFGMMSSTSPYALTGIGQGAMTGVGTYAGLQKGAREEARGLTSARLGLAKIQSAAEEADLLRDANKLYREDVLGQRKAEAASRDIALYRDDLRQYEQMRIKQIESKYKGNPLFGTDPKLQEQFNREVAGIQNDPQYISLLKRAYPDLQLPSAAPAGGSSGWSIKPK